MLLAGLSAVVLLLVAACGTQRALSPLTGPSQQAVEGYCPQAAADIPASPCISAGVEQNQQANQLFNSRIPLPGPVAAMAAPVTRRIRESLERLTPGQRLQIPAVRSALLAGGLLGTDLVVFGGPPNSSSVAFGGYELLSTRPAVCAWGMVSGKAVEVDSGGITREGACLESAGGH